SGRHADPRILLVDDRPELLKSLSDLLQAHGFPVVEALGGVAALDALKTQDFDVVLLDLIMPEVSGHDVLEFAAQAKLGAKIIVVSADSSFDGIRHAMTCGASDFVRKPYDAPELLAALEKALRYRRLELSNEEMEQRVRDSEQLHRFIVSSSPD